MPIEGSVREATSKVPLTDVEVSLTGRGVYTHVRTNELVRSGENLAS